jgi:hypothetical protein
MPSSTSLARNLARLSATELVNALGAQGAPAPVRRGLSLPFFALSRSLGETLAELDGATARWGLPRAADQALRRFGITLRTSGTPARGGPCLVLANHPGAYDALALMSALGRDDLLILAADRVFLRALPNVSRHLTFVGDHPASRAAALKRALVELRRGGSVLHFPAGAIEPDADFAPAGAELLRAWAPGVETLVRACARSNGRLLVAGVRGVHSPRAKRFALNRLAEKRGVTTLSPLLQMAGGLRDVTTRVHTAEVPGGAEPAVLRNALLSAIERASSAG